MTIEATKTYDAKSGAEALNVSAEWTAKWIARGVQRGMFKEQGKAGSGRVLGSDLILICRKYWEDYASECHWEAFRRVRAREQGREVDEEL